MLDGAGRGLADGRGHGGRAPLGDHDPGRAGHLGRAADRAEVVRVLDLVEGDDQGVRVGEQRARIGVGIGIDLGDDALVVGRAGQPLELRRGVSGAVQTRWTRRRPRFASATGRRP